MHWDSAALWRSKPAIRLASVILGCLILVQLCLPVSAVLPPRALRSNGNSRNTQPSSHSQQTAWQEHGKHPTRNHVEEADRSDLGESEWTERAQTWEPGSTAWREGVTQMIAQARELIQRKEFDKAQMICEEAHRLAPDDKLILGLGRRLATRHKKYIELELAGKPFVIVVGKSDTASGLMDDLRLNFPELSDVLNSKELFVQLHNEINLAIREDKPGLTDEEHTTSKVKSDPITANHPIPEVARGMFEHHSCKQIPCDWVMMYGEDGTDVSARAVSQCKCTDHAKAEQAVMASVGQSLVPLTQQLLHRSAPFFNIDQLITKADDGPLSAPLHRIQVQLVKGLEHVAGALPMQREPLEEDMQAQELIWKHQHPQSCKNKRFIVFNFDKAYWGFAANMNFLTVIFNYALRTNRIVITANPDYWNYAGNDCSAGWECYFRPLTNCTMEDAHEPWTSNFRDDWQYDYQGFVYQNDWNSTRVQHYANVDGPWQSFFHSAGHGWKRFIPSQFDHMSFKWWRSQLSRYIIRPKNWVLEYIASRRSAIQFDEHLVAIHVRHGDKSYDVIHQGSYFGGLSRYVQRSKELVSAAPHQAKVKATRFFLSTDDDEVVDEATTLMNKGMIDLIVDRDEKRYNGSHIYAPWGVSQSRWPGFPGNDPRVNTTNYALESIKSIWLMQEPKLFIGTVTSCFSRLVHQLRLAAGHWDAESLWTLDHDPRSGIEGWHPDWIMDP